MIPCHSDLTCMELWWSVRWLEIYGFGSYECLTPPFMDDRPTNMSNFVQMAPGAMFLRYNHTYKQYLCVNIYIYINVYTNTQMFVIYKYKHVLVCTDNEWCIMIFMFLILTWIHTHTHIYRHLHGQYWWIYNGPIVNWWWLISTCCICTGGDVYIYIYTCLYMYM